jgi:hypothetical protein
MRANVARNLWGWADSSRGRGKLEYLPHTPPPSFRYRSEVHRLADEENVRTMDLFSCPQAGDQPIRDPGKEFLLGFVHAKENIISIQSFGGTVATIEG